MLILKLAHLFSITAHADPQKINAFLQASDTVTKEIRPEDKICTNML